MVIATESDARKRREDSTHNLLKVRAEHHIVDLDRRRGWGHSVGHLLFTTSYTLENTRRSNLDLIRRAKGDRLEIDKTGRERVVMGVCGQAQLARPCLYRAQLHSQYHTQYIQVLVE
jgi:hypothetical protein